jgi:hypothetical protein
MHHFMLSHQDAFLEKHGVKLGFMSAFIKASAYALGEVPAVNAGKKAAGYTSVWVGECLYVFTPGKAAGYTSRWTVHGTLTLDGWRNVSHQARKANNRVQRVRRGRESR